MVGLVFLQGISGLTIAGNKTRYNITQTSDRPTELCGASGITNVKLNLQGWDFLVLGCVESSATFSPGSLPRLRTCEPSPLGQFF